jgi:hypothetical protein
MIWHNPATLAALALVAGPVLVHLLLRRHAPRVVFPAMRFVPAVRAAAVRLRAPSDLALLILRIAIVAAAVLAAAQPLLMTAARQRAWNGRVARAIVVDTSPSVQGDAAARLADRAAAGVSVSHRFASPDLREAVRRATEWLATTAVAERDIAVVGDFQRGSIDEADLAGVPASMGIDLLRAGTPHAVAAAGSIDGWRDARWSAALTLDTRSTQVTWTRSGGPTSTSLAVRAGATDEIAAQRAAAAARSFGLPMGEGARPVEVTFAGAGATTDEPPITPWIASAAISLRASALLADAGANVTVGERGGTMTVKTPLSARSPLAPAVIRAVLIAAAPAVIDPEAETTSMDEATLRRMVRHRTPIASARPPADESDARWLWGLALGLIVAEGVVRRRSASVRDGEALPSALLATGGKHADAA